MMKMTTTVTGAVMMPHGKLHVLFGLILMTQYFTDVTTTVSLLSPSVHTSPSGKSSLSNSSSLVMLPAASHTSLLAVSPHQQQNFHHHHRRLDHGNFQLVPHRYFLPQAGSGNISRFTLMAEEGPLLPKMSRKHQKRHSGSEQNSTKGGGGGGNHSNKNSHHHHPNGNRVVESESEQSSGAVVAFRETHLSSTSSTSLASSNGSLNESAPITSPPSKVRSHMVIPVSNDFDWGLEESGDFLSMCRHKRFLPPDLYVLDTCAYCYRYMKNDSTLFGKPSKKLGTTMLPVMYSNSFKPYWILGVQDEDGAKILANVSDPESPIWDTFSTEEARKDWTGCCRAAKQCCERMVASWSPAEPDGGVVEAQEKECPPTWDGWQCWNSTKAGEMAQSYCPDYIYFLTEEPACAMPMVKECDANGTWAKWKGAEWTNYTICALSKVIMQRNRSYVLVGAYAVSLVALVPALIIFFAFKQLRVHRIILHQNLFASLILNALLVIIFKTSVMMSETNSMFGGGDSIVQQNGIGCRLLLLSTKYSRMTNYMWMFCEGFYLHKLIAAAFAEQKSLLVFYLIGWVFPLLPTAIYAIYRIIDANEECWAVPQDKWEWTLNGPSLLSLLVNTVFLINIIRVLVTKLRAAHAQEPSQYRKAVRATLVLLPLFGLHFIVTIYRPSSSIGVCQHWTEYYFYVNDVADGSQGFLVALIFCYCNEEVVSLLKRAYTRWREQHFEVGQRRNSRHRPSRGGSVLGRSVVSTHIYSSIPPSPETHAIVVPGDGGSNFISNDPSPGSVQDTNLLTVNGASGTVAIPNNCNTNKISPNNEKLVENNKSALKNRKNHSTVGNGNAFNMYVSSEYGCGKGSPGVEISCV